MRAAGLIASAIGFMVLGGCGGDSAPPPSTTAEATPASESAPAPEEDAVPVRTSSVRVDSVSSLYTTSVTLRADKQATITARTQGVIRQLLVEEGTYVREGQKLAILEDDEQRIEFERTRSAHETKQREMERSRALSEQGMVSDEEYERIRREADETRHTADLAKLRLDWTVIRAPFSGRIVRRHLDPGATVSNGTEVYDVADLNPLYADVSVPEREVPRLAVGQAVRIRRDDGGDLFDAKIERIAPLVDPQTGTVKVTLTVPAADPSEPLRPGSFVLVEIVTETHADTLVVPRSALVAEGSRWHLFRVGADGTVERLEIERGFEEGDRVEVSATLGNGASLQAGDVVVSTGAAALNDGARVEVMNDDLSKVAAEASGTDRVAA